MLATFYTSYHIQFGWSATHRIFVGWVVFVKAVFLCLNLELDDGFLTHNMPVVSNKTGHGLTDIVIAWDKFKPALHPEYFWE